MRLLLRFRLLVLVGSCLSLAGCGIAGKPVATGFPSFSPRPTVAFATPDASGVQQVTIKAADDRFRPPTISAHPGKIHIQLDNTDSDVHNLTVFTTSEEAVASGATSSDVVATPTVPAHTSAALEVTLTKPGTYKFFCRFHRQDGMFGVLIIK